MYKEALGEKKSLFSEVKKYSISDICLMGYSLILTKLFYPRARLVRRPISVREKSGFKYGEGLTTGRNCRIEIFGKGEIITGRNCRIGDNVHIAASQKVVIGDECLFASKIFISDTSHGLYRGVCSLPTEPPNDRILASDPVIIGDNVWLGENVVVLSGVTIGNGCIIGANAVVTKSIPDNCIAVGLPAKPVKRFDAARGLWVEYRE